MRTGRRGVIGNCPYQYHDLDIVDTVDAAVTFDIVRIVDIVDTVDAPDIVHNVNSFPQCPQFRNVYNVNKIFVQTADFMLPQSAQNVFWVNAWTVKRQH